MCQSRFRPIQVDVEHIGIRVAIPVAIIASAVLLYGWLSTAWPTFLNGVGVDDEAIGGTSAILLTLIGALLIGALADRLLKRVWPSGKVLQIDASRIALLDRRSQTVALLRRDLRLNVRTWRFMIRRSTPRAPRGWYMVACRFMQDEATMVVYTFMPARKFESLPLAHTCQELEQPPDRLTQMEKRQVKAQLLRERAEQRYISELETERASVGAELRPADFASFVNTLAAEVPGWSD